jgi:hypothetical protein
MSKKAKKEYLLQIRERYKSANKKDKNKILDEFCQVCGYNRKYAIRLLNSKEINKPKAERSGRPKQYHSPIIIHFLKILLRLTNLICSKRLKEAIPLWIIPFEKSYCMNISPIDRNKLLNISASTIDRLIGKERRKLGKLGLSTTKPGSLIKKQVPIKTNQWDESRPGFIEADTVAHCGSSVSGSFVYSVNLVDIATGWIETRAIWGKGQKSTFEAIRSIEGSLPFKIKGFDSDNGSEFLNYHLMNYFVNRKQPVDYTRSRPYQKNDNAHIEGKNWTHIRQYLGYERFDDPKITDVLNEMYTKDWTLFFNFFIPSSKLIEKQRQGSKIIKKHDKPKTPFQRLVESKAIPKSKLIELYKIQQRLNPFELQSNISNKINEVLDLIKR